MENPPPNPSNTPQNSPGENPPPHNTHLDTSTIYPTPGQPAVFTPAPDPVVEEKKGGRFGRLRNMSRNTTVAIAAVAVLLAGSAGAYFKYYLPNQPENVWRSALKNTGKGYDRLTQYATAPKNTPGISLNGSFKVSGAVAADGTFTGLSQKDSSQLIGAVSAMGVKVNLDLRTVSTNSNTPDIYFKVDGLAGLGDLAGVGDPALTSSLNGLNNQWYVVDHTLFDQLSSGANSSLQLTRADVSTALKKIGDISKQYVFTSDEKKMVFTVTKQVGKEKIDNRSTYHYKVGVNMANLRAYNNALCDGLANTKLFKALGDLSFASVDMKKCKDTSDLKDSKNPGTADVWVDLRTKLIHKIRFTDKANPSTYFDLGQDYQGGDEFPFSIGFSAEQNGTTTSGDIKMVLNTKTNTFTLNGSTKGSGQDAINSTFNLKVGPSNKPVKVQIPAGAKSIIQLLNDLGFSDTFAGVQSSAKDTERKTDINALQSQLEAYYAGNGYYPGLSELNSPAWRQANMKGLDNGALTDPDGTSAQLMASPQARVYAYQASPAGCASGSCQDYTLTATLDSGSTYTKQSLNSSPGTNVN